MSDDHASTAWHLDKRVPVALIVTLLLQFSAGLWFASKLSFTVEVQGSEIAELKSQMRSFAVGKDDIVIRITRMEERQSAANALLERIARAVAPGQ